MERYRGFPDRKRGPFSSLIVLFGSAIELVVDMGHKEGSGKELLMLLAYYPEMRRLEIRKAHTDPLFLSSLFKYISILSPGLSDVEIHVRLRPRALTVTNAERLAMRTNLRSVHG